MKETSPLLTPYRALQGVADARLLRRAVRVLFVLPFLLALPGCGYSLVGTGSFLPEYIRVVSIPTFVNNTPRFEVEVRITDAVTREFVSRGNFSVVAEQQGADAELTGTITEFVVTPIGLGAEQQQATNYLVQIRAQVNFRDLVQNRILFSNNAFLFRQQFELEENPNEFFDVSNVAVDLIATEFARSVVSSILKGF
jgi:hypothetical protein